MKINTDTFISITEATQNFPRVARTVDKQGSVIIMQNNVPRYLVIDFKKIQEEAALQSEDVIAVSCRIMKQNKEAYDMLAK
ncbi:type II toxin-antitoxin system Phd/YefM family antitoxin [Mitsuokella multacida]|uniref:type II toxin-antitoxin system Phd/YefM family antitoxin n=1 Tax=Mitsuokella multacida TaxID=52226 RepID=UPI0026E07BBE|nr:type II toxin-antitoxin system Phd/YefM family antitoxin [Mitsuokella multacida]